MPYTKVNITNVIEKKKMKMKILKRAGMKAEKNIV